MDNPRAVVDLHRDASFWYEDSLSYKMKFTQYARITPAFPFASTDDLVAHEVPLDSSGHVSVMMFDYMTDRDGSVRSDLRSSSNGGINAGHSFKFLGGIWDEATDEGRFVNLTSGAGLWAPRLIDGFPLLDERFPIRDSAAELPESLKYLVDGNPIEGMKRVYRSTNTMLSQEGRWFEFDSTRNFATFVVDGESGGAGTGHFVVYDAPGIRDAYTVGQFFPFAPIDKVFGVREADGKTVLFPNYGSDSRNDCSSREFASGHGYFKANHHFGMVMDVDFLQPAAGRPYSRISMVSLCWTWAACTRPGTALSILPTGGSPRRRLRQWPERRARTSTERFGSCSSWPLATSSTLRRFPGIRSPRCPSTI